MRIWQQSRRYLGPIPGLWVRLHISMYPQRAPAAPLLIMMPMCSGLQGRTAQSMQAAEHHAMLALSVTKPKGECRGVQTRLYSQVMLYAHQ